MASYIQRKVKEVNGIIEFFEDPCSAPWSVYLRTARLPFGKLAITLLSFGLDDIARGYFRPAGIYSRRRSGRRTRAGRAAAAAGRAIPEIGEMVGHNLPGAKKLAARGVSAGVAALWVFDGVLQRVMFWWMLMDALTEFTYEWTSLVAQTTQCQLDRLVGSVCCKVQPSGYVHDIDGPLACSALEKWWGRIDWDPGTITHYEPLGLTAAAVHVVPWIDEPWRVLSGVTVWIADPANYLIPLSPPSEGVRNADGSFDCIVDAKVIGIQVTRAYITCHGRNGFVTDGLLHGWAYKT